ncbi:hypothetical protein OV207_13305 [Corallococcus sp. BB11-1]|nr:hypothetical protein [Corallococcus sp. BB11-1]MCY1032443.1 hypothetical protein [Corallococcus sp. BB11-1]
MRLRKQTTQWTRAALAGALLLPAAGALANETHVSRQRLHRLECLPR